MTTVEINEEVFMEMGIFSFRWSNVLIWGYFSGYLYGNFVLKTVFLQYENGAMSVILIPLN